MILLVRVLSWKIICMLVPQSTTQQSVRELQHKSGGLGVRTSFLFLSWGGWGLIIKAHTDSQRCWFYKYLSFKKHTHKRFGIYPF